MLSLRRTRSRATSYLHRFFASKSEDLPDRCENIVIGGGIIGSSIAYHLAKMGKDVLLLERDTVTSGTTWHAAGLMVTFGSLSETSTELRKYSKELYSNLEQETGQSTGIKNVVSSKWQHLKIDSRSLEELPRSIGIAALMWRRSPLPRSNRCFLLPKRMISWLDFTFPMMEE